MRRTKKAIRNGDVVVNKLSRVGRVVRDDCPRAFIGVQFVAGGQVTYYFENFLRLATQREIDQTKKLPPK